MSKWAHGLDHVSKGGVVDYVSKFWDCFGFTAFAEQYCSKCVICMQNNIGKGTGAPMSAHPKPAQPFDHVMMDFIELTPWQGKRYCLVLVDMFSRWVEAFPVKHASALAVARVLIREIIPRYGVPLKLSSDNGSHFVNQVIDCLGASFHINLKRHCAYHPQSGGAVEHTYQTLKTKLTKLCAETGLAWGMVLPLALMYMRGRSHSTLGLSPHEVLTGRIMCMPNHPPFTRQQLTLQGCDDEMVAYCIALNNVLKNLFSKVQDALPDSAEGPGHHIRPGDWIVIKDLRRQHWDQPRWIGPFQVLLITQTAVKVAEKATWVHASHCRKVPHEPTGGNCR
ncbi:UNVERIFIED_CONTAM: hypothetical protein FKN15_062284 [Acipenser sinensis]